MPTAFAAFRFALLLSVTVPWASPLDFRSADAIAASGSRLTIALQDRSDGPASTPVTVEDAIRMVRIQDRYGMDPRFVAFSPDGSRFAVVVWRGDLERDVNLYSLLVFDVEAALARPRTTPDAVLTIPFPGDSLDQTATPIEQLSFLADNRTVTFLGTLEGEPRQVHAVDTHTGEVRALTRHPTAVAAYALGADGTLELYATVVPSAADSARYESLRTDGVSPYDPQVFAATGARRMRVALLTGCAQKALNTDINDATIRLLRRLGCEVVVARGMGCCGALTHHMGRTGDSHASAAANIRAWMAEKAAGGLDAIVINTSGCGTTVKDYGHMFRNDPLAGEAAEVSALALDVSELLARLDLPQGGARGLRVAYHAACSLQHGQQVKSAPKDLLKHAGFEVVEPADSHLCCGSAGTYNLLQPEISAELKRRKVATLEAKSPDVIAAGNIGCMMQIGSANGVPVVHTVELLDWATGGPAPRALQEMLQAS